MCNFFLDVFYVKQYVKTFSAVLGVCLVASLYKKIASPVELMHSHIYFSLNRRLFNVYSLHKLRPVD